MADDIRRVALNDTLECRIVEIAASHPARELAVPDTGVACRAIVREST